MSITQLSITNVESLSRVLIFFFLFYFRAQASHKKGEKIIQSKPSIPHTTDPGSHLCHSSDPVLVTCVVQTSRLHKNLSLSRTRFPPYLPPNYLFSSSTPTPPLEDVENDVSSPSVAIPPGGHQSIDSADTEFTMTVWSTHADGKCEVDVENFGDRLVLLSRLVHEGNQFASVQRLM